MRFLAVSCTLAAAVSLAGCSGSSGSAPAPTPSAVSGSPSASVSPTTTESASPSASATAVTTPTPTSTPTGMAACASYMLHLHARRPGAAAGTSYIPLVITDVSPTPCVMLGYPGVSFLDSQGNQLGPAARRETSQRPHRFVLQPGAKAHATVGVPNTLNFSPSDCQPQHATRIRFFPPDETQALETAADIDVCTTQNGQTYVGPMRPGTRGF